MFRPDGARIGGHHQRIRSSTDAPNSTQNQVRISQESIKENNEVNVENQKRDQVFFSGTRPRKDSSGGTHPGHGRASSRIEHLQNRVSGRPNSDKPMTGQANMQL